MLIILQRSKRTCENKCYPKKEGIIGTSKKKKTFDIKTFNIQREKLHDSLAPRVYIIQEKNVTEWKKVPQARKFTCASHQKHNKRTPCPHGPPKTLHTFCAHLLFLLRFSPLMYIRGTRRMRDSTHEYSLISVTLYTHAQVPKKKRRSSAKRFLVLTREKAPEQ